MRKGKFWSRHTAAVCIRDGDRLDAIGPEIGRTNASIARLEEAAKVSAVAQRARIGETAAVASLGEYIVEPDNTGVKIAVATGSTLSELVAADPGLDWGKAAKQMRRKQGRLGVTRLVYASQLN